MGIDFYSSVIALWATYGVSKKQNWAWYLYIFAIVLNIKFYKDMNLTSLIYLELYYFVLVLIGILRWQKANSTDKYMWTNIIVFLAIILLVSKLVFKSSNLETFIAGTGVVAQILLAYKKVMNWIMWIISDFALIILMISSGAFWHTLLYSAYLIIAINGFFQWSKRGSTFNLKRA